jgi:pimeloyl-ACP methyl ester carboxylesterase
LVLFDPSGVPSPIESERQRLDRELGKSSLVAETPADFDRIFALGFVTPPYIPQAVKQVFVDQAVAQAPFTQKIFRDIQAHPALLQGRLAELTVPTLVVWGDTDRITDKSAGPLWRDGAPDATLVVMKQTGHVPMLERPAESAALVQVWWARLDARQPAR